jgi:hypothetical protein
MQSGIQAFAIAEAPPKELARKLETESKAGRIKNWSGIRESNPRLDLGKVAYYHYTNPA